MKDYIYGNVVIKFWEVGGVVVRADQLSEPRHRVEGVIWYRMDNGDEFQLDISMLDFQIRPGDVIYIILAQNDANECSACVLLHHERRAEWAFLADGQVIYETLVEARPSSIPFWISVLLGSAITWYFGSWGLLAGLGIYVVLKIVKAWRKKRLIAGLMDHAVKLDNQSHNRSIVLNALARNVEER